MNIYFLVEGKRTEVKVYPYLLKHFLPELIQKCNIDDIESNNYYIFSAGGYPSILNDINNAIADINRINKFDYFVVCLDADDKPISEIENEVRSSIDIKLEDCSLEIIVQKRCFETWFLGNRKVVKRNPSSDFSKDLRHFDVRVKNPEDMLKRNNYNLSNSQYHSDYLKKMLTERNLNYSKSNPSSICSDKYIKEITLRAIQTDDLKSYKKFLHFVDKLQHELKINT